MSPQLPHLARGLEQLVLQLPAHPLEEREDRNQDRGEIERVNWLMTAWILTSASLAGCILRTHEGRRLALLPLGLACPRRAPAPTAGAGRARNRSCSLPRSVPRSWAAPRRRVPTPDWQVQRGRPGARAAAWILSLEGRKLRG